MTTWPMIAAIALTALGSPQPPTWEEVAAVPPALRTQLDLHVQGIRTPQQRLQQLVEFMFAPDGLSLQYDSEATYTVAETFDSRRGNCLSFTLTFMALAREAGLQTRAQELDQVLVRFGGEHTVFYSGHVNAAVRVLHRNYTVDFDRSVVATRHPPETIPDKRILAHFYNNRGAELLAAGDVFAARTHFDAALELEPGFVPARNNLGVLLFQSGDHRAAEVAYLAALDQDPKHLPVLSNLIRLYRVLGESEKLAHYQRRLGVVERGEPFHNFVQGLQHESRGEYAQALDYFLRAIQLHRIEPRFHLAAARSYSRLGDTHGAERSLARANTLLRKQSRVD